MNDQVCFRGLKLKIRCRCVYGGGVNSPKIQNSVPVVVNSSYNFKFPPKIIIIYIYYLFIIGFYIPPSSANTSEQLVVPSRVWGFGVVSCASDRPFVIKHQFGSLSTKPLVSTTLHYTIIVCCNRTAHSQHCLPASVEA